MAASVEDFTEAGDDLVLDPIYRAQALRGLHALRPAADLRLSPLSSCHSDRAATDHHLQERLAFPPMKQLTP